VLYAAVSVLKITNTRKSLLSFGKYWMKEQPENEKLESLLAQKFAQGQKKGEATQERN
jgi:hypothetical protein